MATPSISYLALDSDYDPVFTVSSVLHGTQAVAQAVLTRLKLFYGEWWEDLTLGLPVFQQILGQLGDARGLQAIEQIIYSNISGAPYVTQVFNVEVTFQSGQFSFTANFNTVFGNVNLASQLPGLSAVIG